MSKQWWINPLAFLFRLRGIDSTVSFLPFVVFVSAWFRDLYVPIAYDVNRRAIR